jgi:hypothetical protein
MSYARAGLLLESHRRLDGGDDFTYNKCSFFTYCWNTIEIAIPEYIDYEKHTKFNLSSWQVVCTISSVHLLGTDRTCTR